MIRLSSVNKNQHIDWLFRLYKPKKMNVYSKDTKKNQQGKPQNEPWNFLVSVLLIVATLAGFFFQDLVSVDVEVSQVKRFDTLTNYQDVSHQYISSITQFSVGYCTILFPLNFKHFSQYLIW